MHSYKVLIALLGRENIQNWVEPSSDWVSLCEGGTWTKEARELFDDKYFTDNKNNTGLLHIHEIADKIYNYGADKVGRDESHELEKPYRLCPYSERIMLFNPDTKVFIFSCCKGFFSEEEIEAWKEAHS